jgi:hypothetical protein
MRIHRFAVVVICCALASGCGGSAVERPATASLAPPAVEPSRDVVKTTKRVATSTLSTSAEVGSTAGAFDVESLNPVKMDPNAASGGKFNPFAK